MTTASNPQQQRHKHLLGHRIADGRLELVSILGLGAYGVVYLARDLTHPLHIQQPFASTSSSNLPHVLASQHGGAASGYYAVKCLNKVDLDSRQKKFQRREIVLHSMVTNHPSIVSLYRVIDNKDDPCIYVIMDYCPDGDLFSMITENQRYAVTTPDVDDLDLDFDKDYQFARAEMDVLVKKVFTQILDAVQFCHVNGIYHRDLKPENILCLQGGAKVVLADFGLATHEKQSNDFGCGSTFYMGPECQGGISSDLKMYNTSANDVWSLGVILVNLICGRNPWKQACLNDETFREYLRNPDFLMDILPISAQTNALLKRVFTIREGWRCSLSELRAMVLQTTRFTATNAELRDRQKIARHAAQRAKEEAIRARQTAENARREAELRHGVEQFYQGAKHLQSMSARQQFAFAEEYSEEDILNAGQVEDAREDEAQYDGGAATQDYFNSDRRDSSSSISSSSSNCSEGLAGPTTPCLRSVDTMATTPASSYSPGSYKSSDADISTPNSPQTLECDSEMTPDNSSSREGEWESPRSSHSFVGMPPTPQLDVGVSKTSNHMEIDCGFRSLAIDGIPDVEGSPSQLYFLTQQDHTASACHADDAEIDPRKLFTSSNTQEQPTRFCTMPSRRALKRPQLAVHTRKLRSNLFGS